MSRATYPPCWVGPHSRGAEWWRWSSPTRRRESNSPSEGHLDLSLRDRWRGSSGRRIPNKMKVVVGRLTPYRSTLNWLWWTHPNTNPWLSMWIDWIHSQWMKCSLSGCCPRYWCRLHLAALATTTLVQLWVSEMVSCWCRIIVSPTDPSSPVCEWNSSTMWKADPHPLEFGWWCCVDLVGQELFISSLSMRGCSSPQRTWSQSDWPIWIACDSNWIQFVSFAACC